MVPLRFQPGRVFILLSIFWLSSLTAAANNGAPQTSAEIAAAGIVGMRADLSEKGKTCTGTLIGPSLVISSAQCALSYLEEPARYVIFFGEQNETRQISKVAIHEDFDPIELTNDLALIALESAAPVAYQSIPLESINAVPTSAGFANPLLFSIGFGSYGFGREPDGIARRIVFHYSALTSVVPTPDFVLLNTGDQFGDGDEGAPIFINRASGSILRAVYSTGSFSNPRLREYDYYFTNSVVAYRHWIINTAANLRQPFNDQLVSPDEETWLLKEYSSFWILTSIFFDWVDSGELNEFDDLTYSPEDTKIELIKSVYHFEFNFKRLSDSKTFVANGKLSALNPYDLTYEIKEK